MTNSRRRCAPGCKFTDVLGPPFMFAHFDRLSAGVSLHKGGLDELKSGRKKGE